MAQLDLFLLGPFQATLDGKPLIGFESDKVRALLSYLSVEVDRPHRREKLAGLLWSDFPEQSARTSLRRALANLRQVIGDRDADTSFFLVTRQTIQFNSHSDHFLDVHSFAGAIEGAPGHSPDISKLEEAITLYRGEFLEGFSLPDCPGFEEWILIQRESFHRQALRVMYRLASYFEGVGSYEQALNFTQRQLNTDPYREQDHQQMMRLLALSGQRNEALAHYGSCRELLAKELGVEQAPETISLIGGLVPHYFDIKIP